MRNPLDRNAHVVAAVQHRHARGAYKPLAREFNDEGRTVIKFLGGQPGEIDAARSITVTGRPTREKLRGLVEAHGFRFLRLLDVREI